MNEEYAIVQIGGRFVVTTDTGVVKMVGESEDDCIAWIDERVNGTIIHEGESILDRVKRFLA